jgi:hypothetical protein
MLACIPRPACRVYRKRSCVSFTGTAVEPENHISGRQARLTRRAGWWRLQHRHAGFAWGSSRRNFVQSDNILYLCALP